MLSACSTWNHQPRSSRGPGPRPAAFSHLDLQSNPLLFHVDQAVRRAPRGNLSKNPPSSRGTRQAPRRVSTGLANQSNPPRLPLGTRPGSGRCSTLEPNQHPGLPRGPGRQPGNPPTPPSSKRGPRQAAACSTLNHPQPRLHVDQARPKRGGSTWTTNPSSRGPGRQRRGSHLEPSQPCSSRGPVKAAGRVPPGNHPTLVFTWTQAVAGVPPGTEPNPPVFTSTCHAASAGGVPP